MLERGILNPAINSLLSRIRHTNTLVIADRGFPYWPTIESVDISLVDGVPRVLEVLAAIRGQWRCGAAFMAEEFQSANEPATQQQFLAGFPGGTLTFQPHLLLNKRGAAALRLIRTRGTPHTPTPL